MNEKQMRQMMRQMGINPVDIPATEVLIRTPEKELVIERPQVSKVNMMGQETWQVVGKAVERQRQPEINEEDIATVADQAGVSREQAAAAVRKHNGDLAAAILELQNR